MYFSVPKIVLYTKTENPKHKPKIMTTKTGGKKREKKTFPTHQNCSVNSPSPKPEK